MESEEIKLISNYVCLMPSKRKQVYANGSVYQNLF